jgi:hypothetical protein
VLQNLETIAESIPRERQTKARSAELVKEVQDLIATGGPAGGERLAGGFDILSSRGISQLPPAGFLPYQGTLEEVGQAVGLLLGEAVRVRICVGRPVDVAQAVQQAQHRDRIRLDDLQHPAGVDILVPVIEESGQPAFDWVAFVHREEIDCQAATTPEEADHVSVWLADVGPDAEAHRAAMAAVQKGEIPADASNLGQLDYPPGTWAVPKGAAYTAMYGAIEAARARSDMLAAAYVTAEGRRPLGAVRAGLLALTFGGDGRAVTSELATAVVEGKEAIVMVFSQIRQVP